MHATTYTTDAVVAVIQGNEVVLLLLLVSMGST